MNELLREGERLDDLQNGFWIIQKPSLFCYGMDAVLLASYARVKPGERAVDLCTGSGIVPILLRAKTKGRWFAGLEILEESAEMAVRSVRYNHLEEDIQIVTGDVREADRFFPGESFDVVTCNPPYMTGSHGLTNAQEALTVARHEVLCTFADVARAAAFLLKPRGRFYLVHRPFRLAELFCTLKQWNLEPKRMRLAHPFADREPNLVLIEAMKGARPRITVEKPLIIYERPGVYTEEVRRWYGDGR